MFDSSSGLRERLALVAAIGPSVDPSRFAYDSHRDAWVVCGRNSVRAVNIRQEGSASLELIQSKWGLGRKAAMELIGYPDAR